MKRSKSSSRRILRYRQKKLTRSLIYSFITLLLAVLLIYLSFCCLLKEISGELLYTIGISEFSYHAKEYPLAVHFIDVGNGDCVLIHTDEVNILVDTGEYSCSGKAAEYLKREGIEQIDLFIATHSDSDHIGDFASVADSTDIKEIWFSRFCIKDQSEQNEDEKIFFRTLKEKNIKLTCPETGKYYFGELSLEIIAPTEDMGSDNDNSIVFRITYKQKSFLFTGDAGKKTEQQLLKSGKDISCDVLKVGHHGSKGSTTSAFLQAASPACAVISAGDDNIYLPNRDIVDRLQDFGCEIYRTDTDGCIIIATDGKELTVFTEKNE